MSKFDISGKMGAFKTKALANAKQFGFAVKSHSPEICLVSGFVAVAAGFVLACVATNDIQETKEKAVELIEDARDCDADGAKKGHVLTGAYLRAAGLYLQKYWKAGGLTLGGCALMGTSSYILKDRGDRAALAYMSILSQFTAYRQNTRDRFGDDVDRELRLGTHKEIVKRKVEGEDGKMHTIKEEIYVIDQNDIPKDEYIFEIGPILPDGTPNPWWDDDPIVTVSNYTSIERALNSELSMRSHSTGKHGVMFKNEVTDKIYYPRTKIGQTHGYVGAKDDEAMVEGYYVSFGLNDIHVVERDEFINRERNTLILELNPAIPIFSRLD